MRSTAFLYAVVLHVLCAAPAFADEADSQVSLTTGGLTNEIPQIVTPASESLLSGDLAAPPATLDSPIFSESRPGASPTSPTLRDRITHYRDQVGLLVDQGMEYIGTPYRRGGSSEAGFDCSGLVHKVFSDALGLNLPRSSRDMARVGEHVAVNELKPGDLVFFKTVRRTISHVGIYLGNNRFLHSPASGGEVRIDDLNDSYWSRHYALARRMLDAPTAKAQ